MTSRIPKGACFCDKTRNYTDPHSTSDDSMHSENNHTEIYGGSGKQYVALLWYLCMINKQSQIQYLSSMVACEYKIFRNYEQLYNQGTCLKLK